MSWLSDFVGPRLREIVSSERTDDQVETCVACNLELDPETVRSRLGVCPGCGLVGPLSPEDRFSILFDDERYLTVDTPQGTTDVLRFRDVRRYGDRLREAQQQTEGRDAVAVARGLVGGNDLVAVCVDHGFLDGTLGIDAGTALACAARLAALQGAPLVVFTGPSVPRVQEGLFAVAQTGQMLPALRELRKSTMPMIVVLAAGYGHVETPAVHGFGDIVIREAPIDPVEKPETTEDPEISDRSSVPGPAVVDLHVTRGRVRDTIAALTDIAVVRRSPAPVVRLQPGADEPTSDLDPGDERTIDGIGANP